MAYSNAMLVFRKDWLEIKRNWQITTPIIIVPLIFSVLLPLIIIIIPSLVSVPGTSLSGFPPMIENLPLPVKNEIAGMTDQQVIAYIFALYFFAPFFLIIPLMASSVIASDSFAGEKERKTIEALLATPLTDSELLLGKILVSFIPSMVITFLSFAVYSIVVDVAAFGLFAGRILLPNLLWLALIFGVAPTVALAGIGITVIISARVKGFREAQQISAVLVLPILLLVFVQIGGVLFFGPLMILLLILVFLFVDLAVFRVGIKLFKREAILSKRM